MKILVPFSLFKILELETANVWLLGALIVFTVSVEYIGDEIS